MKNFLVLTVFLILTSCHQSSNEITDRSDSTDITSSDSYKKYVAAYNDYLSCRQESPQLTQDLMDNKITNEEFATALERNTKVCNAKKRIYNDYYQLLVAQFDQAAAEHKIAEE